MPFTFRPQLDPRLRVGLRAEVSPHWQGGAPVSMETIDLSASGAAIRSPICLPLKTQLSIALHLPAVAGQAARNVSCEAVVVNTEEVGHSRSEWRVGAYFLNLKEPDRESLRRFIFLVMDASSQRWESHVEQG